MGCCQSTSRADSPSSPYSPSNAHGDSSSRAITTASPSLPVAALPSSTHAPLSLRSPRASRTLGLTEQFNAPLRPHVWSSKKRKWTRSAIDREREEYFDTRTTGHVDIWSALRTAAECARTGEESDMELAQGILNAACITVPTGDLASGAYDDLGNFYLMPEVVISDPQNLEQEGGDEAVSGKGERSEEQEEDEDEAERRREEKGKAVIKKEDMVTVKARLSDRGGKDVVITLSKEQKVKSLIRKLREEVGLNDEKRVKIAYMGKILKEGDSLLVQGWQEGHVVNALVF